MGASTTDEENLGRFSSDQMMGIGHTSLSNNDFHNDLLLRKGAVDASAASSSLRSVSKSATKVTHALCEYRIRGGVFCCCAFLGKGVFCIKVARRGLHVATDTDHRRSGTGLGGIAV